MSDPLKDLVYSKNSIEFVKIGVEYCAYLENLQDLSKDEVADKLSKTLPQLYLNAASAPKSILVGDSNLEQSVTEEDYTYILSKMSACFAEDDVYLEVFMEDMKYSETPISANISEDLADIYQDIRNFITIYERGITEHMNDAMCICLENFSLYWGQKLVNVMRPIHGIKYSTRLDNDFELGDGLSFENDEELW